MGERGQGLDWGRHEEQGVQLPMMAAWAPPGKPLAPKLPGPEEEESCS